MENFFDRYPLFYKTSETSPSPDRLNARHTAIIERNRHILSGKRVLDIASHDGRWTFAALQAGAEHVVGVEPRKELIDRAIFTFSSYGIDPKRYEFHQNDIFEYFFTESFDVVLCLGFFYHTVRHVELMNLISSTGAGFVILDSEVTPRSEDRPILDQHGSRLVYNNPFQIHLLLDENRNESMAYSEETARSGHTIVGRPSRAAVMMISDHFSYDCEMFDWKQYFAEHPGRERYLKDYEEGWRDTFYLSRRYF